MECFRFYTAILATSVLFSSCCTKTVDISINDFSIDIQECFFLEIQPDIEYSALIDLMGNPMDYLDIHGDYDEREHSPVYYLSDGKIICHWGGDEDEPMGMIEYIPYESHPLYLTALLSELPTKYRREKLKP